MKMNASPAYFSGCEGTSWCLELHRESACLSPACDRHLIGEFLKIERAKDAAVSCVEETKKAPTVDDRWALVVSLSNEPRGLGKTRRMEDPVVNRSHRAIFCDVDRARPSKPRGESIPSIPVYLASSAPVVVFRCLAYDYDPIFWLGRRRSLLFSRANSWTFSPCLHSIREAPWVRKGR